MILKISSHENTAQLGDLTRDGGEVAKFPVFLQGGIGVELAPPPVS
jgi:hypothetical protein